MSNALLRLLGTKKKHGELKVKERRRLCGSNSNPLRLHPHRITTTFLFIVLFRFRFPPTTGLDLLVVPENTVRRMTNQLSKFTSPVAFMRDVHDLDASVKVTWSIGRIYGTLKLDKGIAPALITLLSCIATFTVDFFPHQLAKRI